VTFSSCSSRLEASVGLFGRATSSCWNVRVIYLPYGSVKRVASATTAFHKRLTYVVKIQSLDGPATYDGVAVGGDHIEFKREGKTESIRAGSGKETGMKWLLEKKDCLIIKNGEGYCRE
jgi:hypothetical protein